MGRGQYVRAPGRPALYIVGGARSNRNGTMSDLGRAGDYRSPYREPENADFFKWVVGGVLTVVAALAGVLWFMLMGQITDLKAQIAELKTETSQLSNAMADLKGDVKLLSARSADQSSQIAEMQGFLKKK